VSWLSLLPSKALLLSRSIVASRLIVRWGVPSEGENVYWDGISGLTITTSVAWGFASWIDFGVWLRYTKALLATTVKHYLPPRQTLRCPPEKRRPTGPWEDMCAGGAS
jgi:hypothetical protein